MVKKSGAEKNPILKFHFALAIFPMICNLEVRFIYHMLMLHCSKIWQLTTDNWIKNDLRKRTDYRC